MDPNLPERDFNDYNKSNGDWLTESESEIELNESLSNISTNKTDELYERNRHLEECWKASETRCVALQSENEKLLQQLSDEKHRSIKIIKKLKYIQDNQEIWKRLRQMYLNMKYNESAARTLVEIKEEECQTYNTETIDWTQNTNDNDSGLIQRNQLDTVKNTIQSIKALIAGPTFGKISLNSITMSDNREAKYRKDIAILFKENRTLRQQIIDKETELMQIEEKQVAVKKPQKDAKILKTIIAKLEKRLKFCKLHCDKEISGNFVTNLNEREQKIVNYITTKFDLKLQKHFGLLTIPKNKSSISLTESNSSTPFFTPRSPKCDDDKQNSDDDDNNDNESLHTFRSCEDDSSQ